MSNILIVGFGNIGKHHLESIINYPKIKKIYIYDIDEKKILDYKKKSSFKKKIFILKNFKKKKTKFSFSIISTDSKVRFKLFKNIVENLNVKHFIFEKVVYQKKKEYIDTQTIIKKYNLHCWINCPRRTWKIYKDLKKKINTKDKIKINIQGKKWGLLSNAVHFIDLFLFFTFTKKMSVSLKNLKNELIISKRKGFNEMYGKIIFTNQNNDQLIINDNPIRKTSDLIFSLKQNKYKFIYNQNDSGNKFKPPYQSKETIKHAKNILNNKNCHLPFYNDTFEFHKIFFDNISTFIRKNYPNSYKKIFIT